MQFHHPKIFNMIIAFFRLFFKDEKCRQKHAEFISEFCVFLFALSIGRFRWMLKNILMRICPKQVLFSGGPSGTRTPDRPVMSR